MYQLSGTSEERLAAQRAKRETQKSSLFLFQWCFVYLFIYFMAPSVQNLHNVFLSTFPQYSELQIILMRMGDNVLLLFPQKKKLDFLFKMPFYGLQCLEERRTTAAWLILVFCLWDGDDGYSRTFWCDELKTRLVFHIGLEKDERGSETCIYWQSLD